MLCHCCELIKGNFPELLQLDPEADISFLVGGTTFTIVCCVQMRVKSSILAAHHWHVGYAVTYGDGLLVLCSWIVMAS